MKLPLTPRVTQKDLQELLGHKNRHTISNWVRYKKLTSPDKDGQAKRWLHENAEIQKQLLLAIREKMPELLWHKQEAPKRRNA